MTKEIVLIATDHKTRAVIHPSRGAWVSSLELPLKEGVREIFFQHDYANESVLHDLPGGLPFLFPICARISREGREGVYLYDGRQYTLKIHGFSWYMAWEVVTQTPDSVELVLRANNETRLHYPFDFAVRLIYNILPGKLQCHQIYYNHEKNNAMPYYSGFHPYFLIPGDKSKTQLQFEAVRRFEYNKTLTDIVGIQPAILTPVNLSDSRINEQLHELDNNKTATLTFENGDKIAISASDPLNQFSYLQLYHIIEKPFFCVEHWMAFPNAMNTVSGVRWLKPGESYAALYEISC